MCLILDGEIRQVQDVKTKNNNTLNILRVLAKIGKTEMFVDVANFSKEVFKPGPVKLNVVPRAAAGTNGRAFLNWATFEGAK